MIRNLSGNFWWHGELFYKLIHPDAELKERERKSFDFVHTPTDDGTNKGLKLLKSQSSSDPDSIKDLSVNQEIDVLLEKQFELEEAYEEKYKKTKIDISSQGSYSPEDIHSPLYKKNEDCANFIKKNSVKMFLSNSGILNLKDINNVKALCHKLTHLDNIHTHK